MSLERERFAFTNVIDTLHQGEGHIDFETKYRRDSPTDTGTCWSADMPASVHQRPGVRQRGAHATTSISRGRLYPASVLRGFDTRYNNLISLITKFNDNNNFRLLNGTLAPQNRDEALRRRLYYLDKRKFPALRHTGTRLYILIWREQTRRPLPRAPISDLEKTKSPPETKSIPTRSEFVTLRVCTVIKLHLHISVWHN